MSRLARFLLVSSLALFPMAVAAQKPAAIGILPVYDGSAKSLTEALTPNLTYMIYRDLLNNPIYQPVLLSPGGLYDPDDVDWIREYAAKAKVDLVLVSSVLAPLKVDDKHSRLRLEVHLLNVASGTSSAKAVNDSVEVKNIDLFNNGASSYVLSSDTGLFQGPHSFEKHPLGKAAQELVAWTHEYVMSAYSSMATAPTGNELPAISSSCDVDFHIRYVAKKSTAKSYTLIANNMDESSTITDGIAHFKMSGGSLALRIQVNDAPYKMPIEKMYQASTILDCAGDSHTLVLEMGNAGDSFLRWQ